MKHSFDDFVADESALELWRGDERISIEPLVFSLLLYLILNSDRVVSKDELVEAVWDNRFVSDAAISSAVRDLRRALGDDGLGQRYVRTMRGRGVRFVAPVTTCGHQSVNNQISQKDLPNQSIRFCHSADGARIAYAVAGTGPPLLKVGPWLTHLELDWDSPIWRHINLELCEHHQLVRYDARGNGLSDWNITDFSLARQVEDLEAVANAAGLDQFPILGMSQAAAFSVAYAAKNPERVSKLVLISGFEKGWRQTGGEGTIKSIEAMLTLMEREWDGSVAITELAGATHMPDAPPEYWQWFSENLRKSSTGKNAANLLRAYGDIDVEPLLSKVRVPTLVLHAREDSAVSYERGQNIAAGIPTARFVSLNTRNHVLHAGDPAWEHALKACSDFLLE